MDSPTFHDVVKAQAQIRPFLKPTPLYHYAGLTSLLGADGVWVKHENHQPIGAFKIRGGINLISQLSDEERRRGVIAASTGNHGQSVAYASRLFGVPAVVVVPQGANPGKVAAIQGLGAEVRFHGRDFDEAREKAEQLTEAHGYRYIHSANEPLLIAGVGTEALEILQENPEIDTIIVAVGGGSGASGCCLAAKGIQPEIQVIGVQAAAAPAAYRSWREGRLAEDSMGTFAEGLATRVGFKMTQEILHEMLDDFVLVSEDELKHAVVLMLEHTHNLVEGAGAAPLAAALKIKDRLRGRRVALVASGGNLSLERLRTILHEVK
ncbi:MAG: threonine/serine dehydratase [Anaerolineae bacterium]